MNPCSVYSVTGLFFFFTLTALGKVSLITNLMQHFKAIICYFLFHPALMVGAGVAEVETQLNPLLVCLDRKPQKVTQYVAMLF